MLDQLPVVRLRILLVVVLISPPSHAFDGNLQSDFRDVVAVARSLMEKYPPGESVYVFLGRSGSPVKEYMQRLGCQVVQLPLSDFRYGMRGEDPRGDADLSAADKKEVFDHFKKVLPSDSVLGGKKLVLFDYTLGNATSLKAAAKYLRLYASENARPLSFSLAALRQRTREGFPLRPLPGVDHAIELSTHSSFGNSLSNHGYDNVSGVREWYLGLHDPGEGRAPREPAVHARFVAHLERLMGADPETQRLKLPFECARLIP